MSFTQDSDIGSEMSNLTPRGLLSKLKANKNWFKKKGVLEKINEAFQNASDQRAYDRKSQASILKRLITQSIIRDFEGLDHLETADIQVIDPIARQRIRINNRRNKKIVEKYFNKNFDLIKFCKLLLGSYTNSIGLGQNLVVIAQVMKLICITLEYGLWKIQDARQLIKVFFLRTEQLHKQEEYINQKKKGFDGNIYESLMICKEHSACILVQIITLVYDEWFYKKATFKEETGILEGLGKLKRGLQAVVKRGVKDFPDDYVLFNEDKQYYSLFSFTMFNYLLYTLKKDGKILSTWKYRRAMHHLFMYVYDYNNDPFGLSVKLLKSDYLAYYLTETIEEDYILEGEKLALDLKKMITDYKIMRTFEVNILDNSGILKGVAKDDVSNNVREGISEANLEKKTGDLFTRLEVLIGLQDETYATRLMITEKTIPFLLINLLDEIQLTLKGEMAEEVFVRGLKILFQLTKGNYLAQAQITVGPAWKHVNTMIEGENGVLTLIYLSELFSRDNLFLHVNETFTYMIIDKFREDFRIFFKRFIAEKSTSARNLVYLFMFQRLLSILIKDSNIEKRLKKPYNLTIAKYLHSMVCKFALPLLRDNKLEASDCYEPKLIKKNWNFENCFSLSALMMLSGEHIRSMLMDFALSLLKLYNASCDSYYPGDFTFEIKKTLPDDLSCFDYLLEFPEGIVFKSEILVTYCNFRIFANGSRIQGKYTKTELSQDQRETFIHYMPEDHLKEIPELIVNELHRFSNLDLTDFEQEDLIDYLLRGICQITYKYCKGVEWYSDSCNDDEVVNQFTNHLHKINTALFKVRQQVQHMKDRKQNPKVRSKERATFKNHSMNELLTTTIEPLIHSLNLMFENSRYEYILSKYELQEKFKDKSGMKTVHHLLISEASFISGRDFKSVGKGKTIGKKHEMEDLLKDADDPLSKKINNLVKYYESVKMTYIKDFRKNLFYKVLQSKMEDNNQRNMISYLVSALSTIQLDVGSRHSLWQDTNSMALLIFLNNSLFWCSKTRKALFLYLNENKQQMERLISTVYKGMRDAFTMLAFSPFDNSQWEYIWSKFYIFSSFIQGLCKENCQEFKKYLGNFQPNLGCEVHKSQKITLLDDLQGLLLKYMMFSGLSKNKTNDILPSDKIYIIPTLERVVRCLIELQTGPCRPNQLKTYSAGTQIWLNLLTRIVDDFDSEYYYLVNITLDYLLSLLEGNNQVILKFFAAAFDIPVMYGLMTKLITILRDRVLDKSNYKGRRDRVKRRANIMKKGNQRPIGGNKGSSSRRERETKKNKHKVNPENNPLTSLEAFRGKMNNTGSVKSDNRSTNSAPEENENMGMMQQQNKINWKEEDKELSNWQDLIEMYKTDAFEGHITLICSIKIFRFLNRVAYMSRKYQIFFDKKEKDLEEKFAEFGYKIEEIQTGQAKLKGKANSDDDLVVYYFMKEVTAKIEILDNQREQEIFIFPKPPCCFYLKQKTINDFHKTCNIENTESKLSDMFESFNEFHREMKSYQVFRSANPIFSRITTDNAFQYAQISCWFFALTINLGYLYEMAYQDQLFIMDRAQFILGILLVTLAIISLSAFMGICWFITNYRIVYVNELARFKKKNPYKNPNSLINFLNISVMKSIGTQPEIMSFLLHIFLGVMGLTVNPIFQSLHLIMIINISATTKYVIQAITTHYDQLLSTIMLVCIMVFSFSMFAGQFYGDLFHSDWVGSLRVCDTLKSCFFTILNLGLRNGGGIAESMNLTDINSPKHNFYIRVLFDIGFFILINIISLNIIFGIIIDTFAELRTKQREREWDSKNRCDICGLEKRLFEKRGISFSVHKKIHHNLWDYVFYLVYLHTLDSQSLTGFEFFVFHKFKNNSTAWLPIKSTLYLEDGGDDEMKLYKELQGEIRIVREDLMSEMGKMNRRFDRIEELLLGKKKK